MTGYKKRNKNMANKLYPRTNDNHTCSLKDIVQGENIVVGEYSYYHDFKDPLGFENNNVLYHYPVNKDKLIIGKFCSIAHGVKFIFNGGNHKNESYVNYPFAIFGELWDHSIPVTDSWDNKGDIIIGNDVWIGHEAMIMSGVTIGNGARIGSRAVVTKNVNPYEVVVGVPARVVKKRFGEDEIELLEQIQWWNWTADVIRKNMDVLMHRNINELKTLLK